jgi:hypothetical protein
MQLGQLVHNGRKPSKSLRLLRLRRTRMARNKSEETNSGKPEESKPQTLKGYDSALRERLDDDLGRWRFAAEIAEVIRSTPSEWSARIGIFGKWGEGKSTVLHFLDSMLRSEENIIFTFNPWAVQDLDEMWAEFGTDLIEALESEDILVEPPWKRFTRSAKEKLGALKDVAEGAAALAGKDQMVKSTFGRVAAIDCPKCLNSQNVSESLRAIEQVL